MAGLSLPGLTLTAGGLVLAYSGVQDVSPVDTVRSILSGKLPTPGAQTATAAAYIGSTLTSAGTTAGAAAGSIGSAVGVGATAAAAAAGGARSKIIATAQSYLGVRYRLGGASRTGVDCSGLVLLAYKSVGISLPHKASLQAALGRRIDRSAVKPGDLVAWGAPGNYPHIALAMNATQVIVAPHTGTVVQYQTLWEKKVPGFGYPTIVRILED